MRLAALTAVICALAPLVAFAVEKLNVRVGAWEVSATTQVRGIPLSTDRLAKMTAAQRAELQAAQRAEAAQGPQTAVTRECVTEEDLERPFSASHTENCTQAIVETSRTTQQVRLQCTGERPTAGVLRVTAPNPETMRANLELRAGEGADAFVIETEMKGRWLEAACEDEDAYDEDDVADDSDPKDFDEPEDEL